MADTTERIRTELELENSSFLAALRAADTETSEFMQALALFEGEETRVAKSSQSLADALSKLAIEEIKLDSPARTATAGLKDQAAATASMASATTAAAAVKDRAAESSRNFGSTILYASYAVQDFTSQIGTRGMLGGLAAIQNNIPQILVGLGVGTGFAGVVSLAAVAVGTLASNLGGVSESAKKVVKDLEDVKAKADKLRETTTADQDDTKSLVGAVMKGRGKVVDQGIRASLYEQAKGQASRHIEEYYKKFGVVPGTIESFIGQDASGKFTGEWGEQAENEATRLLGNIETDPSARARVGELARARPGSFPRGFADELRDAEPEAQAEAKAADMADEAAEAERVSKKERRFEAAKEYNRRRKKVEDALKARTDADIDESDRADAEQKAIDTKDEHSRRVAAAFQPRAAEVRAKMAEAGLRSMMRGPASRAVNVVEHDSRQEGSLDRRLTTDERDAATKATIDLMRGGADAMTAAINATRGVVQQSEAIKQRFRIIESEAKAIDQFFRHNRTHQNDGG